MTVFADSSWWVPFKCRKDVRHAEALKLFDHADDCELFWTPWHRVEVFNTIRQLTRSDVNPLPVPEAKHLIRLLEDEVRLGYYLRHEFDWRDAIREACSISASIAFEQRVRSMDLFHVAIAADASAALFVSFDEDQLQTARSAGLRVLNPADH